MDAVRMLTNAILTMVLLSNFAAMAAHRQHGSQWLVAAAV
jgi:hypothetical protein